MLRLMLVSSFLFATVNARAEDELESEFAGRIEAAYAADGRDAALLALFHLDGVDEETLQTYRNRVVKRMFGKHEAPTIAFEAFPEGYDPGYVYNGYSYKPNLEAVGMVVLGENTRAAYGLHEGRYIFPGTIKTQVAIPERPDQTLQMMVIGMGHPAVRFEGWCDVMQSDGNLKRMTFEDNGNGNTTAIIMGQYISACDLTNLSARDAISLTLTEGKDETFKKRIEAPETRITFTRD